MIQRIQSILLFIVAVIMFAVAAVLPIWSAYDGTKTISLMAQGMVMIENGNDSPLDNTIAIMIAAILAGVVSLFSIFQFKNRMMQMKLGALNSFLIGATLIAAMYYIGVGESALTEVEIKGGNRIGFWVLIVAALSNWLANRFIRKDERLVRDADRLR